MRSGCRWSRCRRASAEHEAVEFHFAGRPRRSRLRRGNSSAVRRRGESVRRAPRRDLPGAYGEARVPADGQAGAIARGWLSGRHGDRDKRGAAAARARRQGGRWRRQAGRARRHRRGGEREGAATRHFHPRSLQAHAARGALGGLHRPEEWDQRQACRGDSPAARNCRRGESKGHAGSGRLHHRAGRARRDRARHPPDQRDPAGEGRAPCRPAAARAAEVHRLRRCSGSREPKKTCSRRLHCASERTAGARAARGLRLYPARVSGERPVILVVDDSSDLVALTTRMLADDYEVLTAEDAGTALELAAGTPRPDLILLDVEMPGATGFDVCRVLKSEGNTSDIPVIFLTSKAEGDAQLEGLQIGAVDYVLKPANAGVLKMRIGLHLGLANRQLVLERAVQERTVQLDRTRTELIRRLARVMELHESSAVGNRIMRLSQYAKLISQAAGAKQAICDMMMKAAPLHDIGKLGVPSEILRKRERLSVPDWEQVRRHPKLGADIIGEHDDPLLQLARQLALTHHEHWDGSGYPERLRGNAIPWPGRVMAIVDSFESMTTTQFYRDAMPIEKAAAEILSSSGKKFDPTLVEAFRKALPVMTKVRETYSDALGDMINLDFSPARGSAAPARDSTAAAERARAKANK